MADLFPGCYRATIADVADPEKRGRYRVRVHHIHEDSTEVPHLPWAEYITPAGRDWGDLPHFEVGDLVIIMFEGGERRFPFILGGWLTAPKGVSDLPARMIDSDYSTNRRRWVRADRAGNLIEVSEVAGERHVYLKSGDAEIEITQEDDGITMRALNGIIKVESPDVRLGTGNLNGVVTGAPLGTEPVDTFTGKPTVGSSKVKAAS